MQGAFQLALQDIHPRFQTAASPRQHGFPVHFTPGKFGPIRKRMSAGASCGFGPANNAEHRKNGRNPQGEGAPISCFSHSLLQKNISYGPAVSASSMLSQTPVQARVKPRPAQEKRFQGRAIREPAQFHEKNYSGDGRMRTAGSVALASRKIGGGFTERTSYPVSTNSG